MSSHCEIPAVEQIVESRKIDKQEDIRLLCRSQCAVWSDASMIRKFLFGFSFQDLGSLNTLIPLASSSSPASRKSWTAGLAPTPTTTCRTQNPFASIRCVRHTTGQVPQLSLESIKVGPALAKQESASVPAKRSPWLNGWTAGLASDLPNQNEKNTDSHSSH